MDPIYYCELLKTCTVKDDGDAKINSIIVSPQTVDYGNSTLAVTNSHSVSIVDVQVANSKF